MVYLLKSNFTQLDCEGRVVEIGKEDSDAQHNTWGSISRRKSC